LRAQQAFQASNNLLRLPPAGLRLTVVSFTLPTAREPKINILLNRREIMADKLKIAGSGRANMSIDKDQAGGTANTGTLTLSLEDEDIWMRILREHTITMNKDSSTAGGGCGDKCRGSCISEGECQKKYWEPTAIKPEIPPDSGIDLSGAEGLCGSAEGVIGEEEFRVEFRGGECPRPICFEWLAQCLSKENTICYNLDRIEGWVNDIVCRVAGYVKSKCLDTLQLSLPSPILGPLIMHNVALTAYSYLTMHERAHCAGISDEGEATAYALYHTFTNLIMRKSGRGKPLLLIPLDGRGHKIFIITFLTRYLTIYEIARQAYNMPNYWNFVRYLKLPLTMPACSMDLDLTEPYASISLNYNKGSTRYLIDIHIHTKIYIYIQTTATYTY